MRSSILVTCSILSFLAGTDGLVPAIAVDVPREHVRILMYEDRRDPGSELRGYLESTDPGIRARAALALGRIGHMEDIDRVAALLSDPDTLVRRTAAFALGEIEDSLASVPLTRHILGERETDAETRRLCVEGLGKLGQGPEACRLALHDLDPGVQRAALLAAWRIPVNGIVPELTQIAHHKLKEVRHAAAYCAMRFLGAPASGRTPIPGGVDPSSEERASLEDTLLHLSADSDVEIRLQALRGLRSVAGEDAEARLREALADDDWRIRVEAIRGLAAEPETEDGTAPRGVTVQEAARWIDDPNPNVGAAALEALSTVDSSVGSSVDACAALEERFDHPDPRYRELAFRGWTSRLPDADETRDDPAESADARNPESGAGSDAAADSATDSGSEDPSLSSLSPQAVARVSRAISGFSEDSHWAVRAACIDAAALLPDSVQGSTFAQRVADEPRVAKLAVGPYLAWRVRTGAGPGILSRCEPELGELAAHADPMVRAMTLEAARTEMSRDGADPTDTDWTRLESLLQSAWDGAQDPSEVDVRQQALDVAASFVERPAMEALVRGGLEDPDYVVRRTAIQSLEDAGIEVDATAAPVETRHGEDDYRRILTWAQGTHGMVLETAGGEIELELFTRAAPLTCWNFVELARAGFYDGGNWHRVVPNFVLQDGCPRGDGWGGPDHQIRCEINRHRYVRGALGMALAGKDTGGSQFFITHSSQPHLDGGYTVFGRVVSGMDLADRISQADPITRIRVVERPPGPEPAATE